MRYYYARPLPPQPSCLWYDPHMIIFKHIHCRSQLQRPYMLQDVVPSVLSQFQASLPWMSTPPSADCRLRRHVPTQRRQLSSQPHDTEQSSRAVREELRHRSTHTRHRLYFSQATITHFLTDPDYTQKVFKVVYAGLHSWNNNKHNVYLCKLAL